MSRLPLKELYPFSTMKRFKILLIIALFSYSINASAQCSVCRAGAESSVEQGYTVGKGLNKGILYLMTIPYAMGGIAVYIYFKNKKKYKAV